jgi:hypothetical protein
VSARGTVRARTVRGVVHSARAGLRAARALECALFFAAAVLLTLAAGRLSGVQAGAWGVACLCGALAAASWWLEHPSPLAATARTLDACLRHRGALTLAFELEAARAAHGLSPMEELVCARVLARLGVREALRAVLPPFSLALAAPALAALVLLFVLDQRDPRGEEGPAVLGAGLERALAAGLEPEGASRDSGEEAELGREVQALRALLQSGTGSPPASAGSARAAEEARALLERLDQRVARRLLGEAPGSEARARLEEARAWLDALRTALAPAVSVASAGAPDGGSGSGNLTGTPRDGTISPPMAEPELPPSAPATPPAVTLGRQAGSFWPAEYDAVVERWVELSRAERSGNGR